MSTALLQRCRVGSRRLTSIQNRGMNILASISSRDTPPASTPTATSRLFSAPAAAYNQTVDVFPSIVIGSDGSFSAQGPFAESQAQVREISFSFVRNHV